MKTTLPKHISFGRLAVLAGILLMASGIETYAAPERSQVYAPVYSPEIPAKTSICGQNIDLDKTEYYEAFDRELTSIIYNHGTTMLVLKRANRYFPELAPLLKANGVPEDFLYLAIVESTLNNRAYSPAKAAGLWQFIPSTAKQYGLEVNDDVDERYNLEKATAAACRYFKSSYAKFGDWPSVMAAYNGGPTRITNELSKQQAKTSLDLWLTEETSRYPFRVMAYKEFMKNPAKYGYRLTDKQLYQPRKYRTVTVNTPVEDWTVWAKKQGITYAQLRDANPWIRSKTLPNKTGKSYTVKIPLKESLSRKTAGTNTYSESWTVD